MKTRRGWRDGHPYDNGVEAQEGWRLCLGPCYMARPTEDFQRGTHSNGLDSWCKHCVRIRDTRRKQLLKIATGEELTAPKPKRCPICRQERPLVFDHNHETGAFRGWICGKCNTALGMADDDPEALERAAQYLRDSR